MEKYGIDLVTHSFGFTMKYFKMTFYRFLCGNLAPGQETSIRNMLIEDGDRSMHPKKFQAHLMRALEGYALARRTPGKIVPFPVDRPASFLKFNHDHDPFLFPPPGTVKVLSFDGHFGVHIRHKDFEPSRREADPKRNSITKRYLNMCQQGKGKAGAEEQDGWMAICHRSAFKACCGSNGPCRERIYPGKGPGDCKNQENREGETQAADS